MSDQRWEYRAMMVSPLPDLAEAELNALGADGWELVAVEHGRAWLKRPVQGFRERVTLAQRAALDRAPDSGPDEGASR